MLCLATELVLPAQGATLEWRCERAAELLHQLAGRRLLQGVGGISATNPHGGARDRRCQGCFHRGVQCSSCGASNPEGFRFCGACGTALADARASLGNRRRVTILFADIVGFSTLAERLDPEELRELIAVTFSQLTTEISSREGAVEKFIGDAVMAVFGAPRAHEDDPIRAVEAAIAMLDTVQRRSEGMPTSIRLRIGINTGLVVSGPVGDGTQTGVVGDAVNVAARLQQGAEPDQVLVSDPVWKRIRGRFAGECLGEMAVKGREERVTAYRVDGPRGDIGVTPRTPFIGRSHELATLENAWSETLTGNGRVVSVVGEPGVGKSRLVAEFPLRDSAVDVRVDCEPRDAFGPMIDAITMIVRADPDDDAGLTLRLASLGLDADKRELLARFLGRETGDARQRETDRARVYDAVHRLLVAAAHARPILLALNDVHWADNATIDLLRFLIDRVGDIRLMLLLTFRPEFHPQLGDRTRLEHPTLRIEPLSEDESIELARGFLAGRRLSRDLERLVADRAEGNAFFIEELLRMLLDAGALLLSRAEVRLQATGVSVPETVESTIVARIDRLGSEEREAVEHAAVIGRAFSLDVLRELLGRNIDLVLTRLMEGQILLFDGGDAWSFKHALIQEVAYEGILLRRRRDLHRKVAEAIEAMHTEDPTTLGSLAEHFLRAGVPEKARAYAIAAGDVAVRRAGFVEARVRYRAALDQWGEGDEEDRLRLQTKLGYVALMASDLGLVEEVLTPSIGEWSSLGNHAAAGEALAILGRAYSLAGETDRGEGCLVHAIELLGDRPTAELVQAHVWMASLHQMRGDVQRGLPAAKRGLRMAEELHSEEHRANLLNSVGVLQYMAGDASGLEIVRGSEVVAEASGDPEAIGRALMNMAFLLVWSHRFREVLELSDRGLERLEKLGMPGIGSALVSSRSTALMELGSYSDAEATALELLGPRRATAIELTTLHAAAAVSQTYIRTGRFADAERIVERVLPRARRMNALGFSGGLLIAWAELLEATERLSLASDALRELLELAPRDGPVAARFWALVPASRFARSLADPLIHELAGRVDEPAKEVMLMEARANLFGDRATFHDAAEAYAALGMPYQEARCRLEAGGSDRASEIVDVFGLGEGPVGARLRSLSGQPGARGSWSSTKSSGGGRA
jgi:adenylate cyclase